MALTHIAIAGDADEFTIDDLHISFSRNGEKTGPQPVAQQLFLNFDEEGGVTVRIESRTGGVVIKSMSA